MPMPARSAWRFTVLNSHCSVALEGAVMTCAPTERLAIHFEMNNEISEPAKPITIDITNSALKLMPPD